MRLRVTFGPSRSPHYTEAVSIAKSLPSHKITEKGEHIIDEIVTLKNWYPVENLVEMVGKWSSTSMETDAEDPAMAFAEYGGVEGCYAESLERKNRLRHCLGQGSPTQDPQHFGCRFVVGVRLLHPSYSVFERNSPPWWEFGTMDPECKSFLIDRDEIMDEIERANKNRPCIDCPNYSRDVQLKVIGTLPSLLVLGEDWVPRYSTLDPTRIIGVQPGRRLSGIVGIENE